MGVKIVVDTQHLLPASNSITEKANTYRQIKDNLFHEINYMGSNWQGSDNLAFVNQVNGFKDDFDQLHAILLQYAEMLQLVDKEYQKAISESLSIANSI